MTPSTSTWPINAMLNAREIIRAVSRQLGLPELPASRIMMHSTLTDSRSRDALRTLAAAFREHRQPRQAQAA
ncbi:hypothetical protein [Bordetella ansorpii]|uniref:hypothetical protein n=1 Tax=Bordetella ansorpii TaxID=288768 RepID=UPI00082630D5|nr:hypothetical protein [Bordetella ansorpii]